MGAADDLLLETYSTMKTRHWTRIWVASSKEKRLGFLNLPSLYLEVLLMISR
jgi:hypothetical protein